MIKMQGGTDMQLVETVFIRFLEHKTEGDPPFETDHAGSEQVEQQ